MRTDALLVDTVFRAAPHLGFLWYFTLPLGSLPHTNRLRKSCGSVCGLEMTCGLRGYGLRMGISLTLR